MRDAVLFNGLHSLDFQDIRFNVVRIPEVSAYIKKTQEIWDRVADKSFNFHNFLLADDSVYLSNIKLKSLAAAIVQVGLFERYLKHNKKPQMILGAVNGDSAARVCAGEITFEQMIVESGALTVNRPTAPLQLAPAEQPLLAGVRLAEYGLYKANEQGTYGKVEIDGRDINKVVRKVIDDHDVLKVVNVGPGITPTVLRQELGSADVQWLESIELDPMLTWFWNSIHKTAQDTLPLAQ